jgi:hypothetical protein
MYGVEAQTGGGGGGLAAQLPSQDLYFPQALGVSDPGIAQPGGMTSSGVTGVAYTSLGRQIASGLMHPEEANGDGTAATVPTKHMQKGWSTVLDFHNSPAPWILGLLLLLFGWLHVSVRAKGRAGRASVGGAAVL